MGALALVAALVLLSMAFVAIWSSSSQQLLSDVARGRRGQQAVEMARSALAETLFNIERTAGDPDEPLFTWFRSLTPAQVGEELRLPDLIYSADQAARLGYRLEVRVELADYRPLAAWTEDAAGALAMTCRVLTGSRQERTLDERRTFRVQRISLPDPLDRWVLAPPAGPGLDVGQVDPTRIVTDPVGVLDAGWRRYEDAPIDPRDLYLPGADPADIGPSWRDLAAFEVPVVPGAPGTSLAGWIGRRTDPADPGRRINGIVLVDSQEACDRTAGCAAPPPQKLDGLVFRGKALIVVTGPVELGRIAVANPAEDVLNLIAYGPVTTRGIQEQEIQAQIVQAPVLSPGSGPPRGSIRLTGSLIDLTGASRVPPGGGPPTSAQLGFKGTLVGNPAAVHSGPAHLVVLISPLAEPSEVRRS